MTAMSRDKRRLPYRGLCLCLLLLTLLRLAPSVLAEGDDSIAAVAPDAQIEAIEGADKQLAGAVVACNDEIERAYRAYVLAVQRAKQRLERTASTSAVQTAAKDADAAKAAQILVERLTRDIAVLDSLRTPPQPVAEPKVTRPQPRIKNLASHMTRTRWHLGHNPSLTMTFEAEGKAQASHIRSSGRWFVKDGLIWIDAWQAKETNGWELAEDGKTLTQTKGTHIGAELIFEERFER